VAWLTSLPVGVLVVCCLAIALLVAVGSRLATKALVPESQQEGVQGVAAPMMPPLGAAFAILAALTLASEAGFLSSAQQIVSNEAADASRLAWAATVPGVHRRPIQTALGSYLVAYRTHEWHGSSAAEGDDAPTMRAVANLERVVRAEAARTEIGTPTSSELLAGLDALTSDRRARLASASRELPGFYVITLAFSGVALIAGAAALTIRARRRVAFLIGGLTVVVGLSLALILALANPWRGTTFVSGHPVDQVIRDLSTGYFHP
jgi:hypothetical protein